MGRFPDFYDPGRIGTLFYPDVDAISEHARGSRLRSAAEDDTRTLLLLIDMQVDFCHEQGTLFVPGAPDDIRRTIEFIYSNVEGITHITATLDSHLPFQIFHAAWWVDRQGRHPKPYTVISREDVENGMWIPTRMVDWSLRYVRELEKGTKKQLLIWPYHVPIGGVGNAIDPELWSAVFWHSFARQAQPTFLRKGSIPETEHYSVLKPEIDVPGKPAATLDTELLDSFDVFDTVLIAGEAASHCVLDTVEDIVEVYRDRPEELRKFVVLQDCTSPVVHPEIDFEAITRERFREFQQAGVSSEITTDLMAPSQRS